MMLNVVPELQVDPESSVFGLPKGIKLQCYITYHDRDGREFTATSNVMKYHLHKIDRVSIVLFVLNYLVVITLVEKYSFL